MNIATANRLMEHRKSRNFSQEELSSLLGVSRQAISKWERGEASPDTDKLIALAGIYQISMDELLGLADSAACAPVVAADAAEVQQDAFSTAAAETVDLAPLHTAAAADIVLPPIAARQRAQLSAGAQHLLKMVGVVFWAFCFVIYGVLSMFFPSLKGVYPVLCTLIYLVMGFGFCWWHPGWIIFLTIPLLFGMF